MTDADRAVLIEDFKVSYAYGISFSTMRVTAYGIAVTIISVLAKLSTTDNFVQAATTAFLLMLAAIVSTQVIITVNRGTYIFIVHCKGIEAKLGVPCFASVYSLYSRRHPSNTGIYAFWIATIALNVAAYGCAAIILIAQFEAGNWQLAGGLFLVTTGFACLAWTVGFLLHEHPRKYRRSLQPNYRRVHRRYLRVLDRRVSGEKPVSEEGGDE